MNTELDAFAVVLMVIVIAFFAIVLLVGLIIKLSNFSHKLAYLNIEIARTVGAECEYWKRKKRRHWLSLLPFFESLSRNKVQNCLDDTQSDGVVDD